MSDRIEKSITIEAPVSRVWEALTDHRKFGEWFRVRLDGPFVPGEISTGNITLPGYEHLKWEAVVEAIEPERYFAMTWHPYAVDPERDYSGEPQTLIEFTLEPTEGGTLLRVVESGFNKLPPERRDEAYRMNEGGWGGQMKNIKTYVQGA